MRIKKLYILPIAVVALALVIAGCTKDGDPTKSNVAPDTRILSYVISSAAELDTLGNPTSNYSVTVYWAGSDIDGTVKSFAYEDDAGNSGEVTSSQRSFVYDFANAGAEYTLQVRARDNLNELDKTAAEIKIVRNAGTVETAIIDGPPHGAEVSPGITYKVGATSGTGSITSIEHSVNNGAWTSVAADENGEALIDFLGLPEGSVILSFKGVRDDDVEDPTPASISLLVRDGKFAPVLESTSPVVDGGGWFEGVTLTFSWTTTTSHYYGAMAEEGYTWEVGPDLAPPANFNLDWDSSLGDGWSSATSADYDPTAGTHAFYLKCRDTGGGVDTLRIRFSAASPTFDQGILVVSGVDVPTYTPNFTDKIDIGAYWGTFNVDYWDLFGDDTDPTWTLPASATYVGGGSQLSPDVMAKYSTIVWLGNTYNGDFELWALTPSYAYLQAGGNMILASRYLADFCDENMTAYANVAWREGAAAGAGSGSTILEYEPVFPGLITFEEFRRSAMSATDVWSGGGFLDSTDDGTVTDWDGASGYSSDEYTTLLFAHRSNGYNADYPFDYVRGLGSWAHPNFAFSSLEAGDEFPTAGTSEAQGNLILISGRHYGFADAAVSANFDYMLKNMTAEQ